MSNGVCAVVVTYNRKVLLRPCLHSLLKQTRSPDCIVVVDNASTDGTGAMLDAEFPDLARLNLKSNTGGAGGFKAGMQWAHCRGYEWMWLMDDDIEMAPGCLETMLEYRDVGDVIQVRKMMPDGPLQWQALWDISTSVVQSLERETAFENGRKWIPIQYCNFEGAFIRRSVVDRIGFPDERFFISGDDTVYGLLASLHVNVIYIDYIGVIKRVPVAPLGRLGYYIQVRNRFLIHEILRANGIPTERIYLLISAFHLALIHIRSALRSPKPWLNSFAVIEGLRDGLHRRYGRPPWL